MKKFIKITILSLLVFSAINVTAAKFTNNKFGWVATGAFYTGWYPKSSTLGRNLNDIKTSIVKYGNSKKNWSTAEATKIQDKWFDLQKSNKYINVIVNYTFSNVGDPNFMQDPYLASGTPQ